MSACPQALAEMNTKDLKALGLRDGDNARISTADGLSIRIQVRLSHRAMEGLVIVPAHFSALGLNLLTKWDEPEIRINIEKV